MENWGRQKWDNQRRSYNKRPPRVISQPTVPSWEKQFCKVIGSVDWGSILRMQKFMHLYDNVINWDDSAVEETFHNEKKRFWAKIKGLPCDIPLPDPDLYIDKIDWDNLEINQGLYSDLENDLVTSSTGQNHGPVIIFGDAVVPKESGSGWGDEEENFKVLNSSSFANLPPPTGWGDLPNNDDFAATGWGDNPNDGWGPQDEGRVGPKYENAYWGPQNESRPGPGYENTYWGAQNESRAGPGYENAYGGTQDEGRAGPGYENAYGGPQNESRAGPGYENAHWGPRNEGNGCRYWSRNRGSRFRGNDGYRPRNYEGRHRGTFGGEQEKRRNSTPGPPVSHRGGVISIGQTRKQ